MYVFVCWCVLILGYTDSLFDVFFDRPLEVKWQLMLATCFRKAGEKLIHMNMFAEVRELHCY